MNALPGVSALSGYPARLIRTWATGKDRGVFIRPALPEDRALTAAFLAGLSADSRYQRHFQHGPAPDRELLRRLELVDYSRHMVLVAVTVVGAREAIVGHAEWVATEAGAEFALVIADDWQRCGLGSQLLAQLETWGRIVGLSELHGEIIATNLAMLGLAQRAGFQSHHGRDARVKLIRKSLAPNATVVPAAH